MTMKECYVEIIDQTMTIPAEVLEVLPQNKKLYLYTDSERGTVTIYAKDPTDLPNKWFFEEMAQIHAGEDWETYSEPVPPELLRRPRKEEGNE
ncbi:hypothetical protein V8J88_24360 [Massilia sp. W12]|uniref:hypothetical protein n=1 Tax=Massilia sp. W12 TaxID=3126507 RepID=UPI0030D39A9B